jgi:hypothetical protein
VLWATTSATSPVGKLSNFTTKAKSPLEFCLGRSAMRAKVAAVAAVLVAWLFAAPLAAPWQAARITLRSGKWLFALDHQREPVQKTPQNRPGGTQRPIILNAFPNLAAPASGNISPTHDTPGENIPGPQQQAPGERGPAVPARPQFSPRLQRPNGKTDGKTYPA